MKIVKSYDLVRIIKHWVLLSIFFLPFPCTHQPISWTNPHSSPPIIWSGIRLSFSSSVRGLYNAHGSLSFVHTRKRFGTHALSLSLYQQNHTHTRRKYIERLKKSHGSKEDKLLWHPWKEGKIILGQSLGLFHCFGSESLSRTCAVEIFSWIFMILMFYGIESVFFFDYFYLPKTIHNSCLKPKLVNEFKECTMTYVQNLVQLKVGWIEFHSPSCVSPTRTLWFRKFNGTQRFKSSRVPEQKMPTWQDL